MKAIIEITRDEANHNLRTIRELQSSFLRWTIEDISPADEPGDILFYLRAFAEIDQLILKVMKNLEEQHS